MAVFISAFIVSSKLIVKLFFVKLIKHWIRYSFLILVLDSG